MAADPFSKLKQAMDRSVAAVGVKAASSLEKAKLRTYIDSLQEDADRRTRELGAAVYALWRGGAEDRSGLEPLCIALAEKLAEVERTAQALEQIDQRDRRIFGEEESRPSPPQSAAIYSCGDCGVLYDAPVKFCRVCGRPITPKT